MKTGYIESQFLQQDEHKYLLRFTTAGSVDDGKSTLIGRLLHDSKSIYEDHLDKLGKDSKSLNREDIDYALLTDGLKSEREQGITIDVAYRYFSTPKRRFIIADTPGHEQYTRNMATGASTANLAVILIDACHGVLTQSKRHAFISSLLGIKHVIVAVNKMDLADYSRNTFEEIKEDFSGFCTRLSFADIRYIPISALKGDNVVNHSENMPWYEGNTLLNNLESIEISGDRNLVDFRFPVQYVNRPNPQFRGFCGTVASGVVKPGDKITALPSGKSSRVREIVTYDGKLDYAFPPQSVTIVLEDEIDISRGDMLVHPRNLPNTEYEIEAMLVWMSEEEMHLQRPYRIKHTTQTIRGTFTELLYKIDPNQLHRIGNAPLQLNEIGRVSINLFKPLMVDEYMRNRTTGGFVVIDPLDNSTVACGIVIERSRHKSKPHGVGDRKTPVSRNITRESGYITRKDREKLLGGKAATLWFTGLSGSGKSTIAQLLEKQLNENGILCYVLDGDNIRHGLNNDLGFSAGDRSENIRRVAEVAKLFNDAGITVISSFISPYRQDREKAREIIGDDFKEVFIEAPLEECEKRDPKGLYRKARDGDIPQFTGISAPYEAPEKPDVILNTLDSSPVEAVNMLLKKLI